MCNARYWHETKIDRRGHTADSSVSTQQERSRRPTTDEQNKNNLGTARQRADWQLNISVNGTALRHPYQVTAHGKHGKCQLTSAQPVWPAQKKAKIPGISFQNHDGPFSIKIRHFLVVRTTIDFIIYYMYCKINDLADNFYASDFDMITERFEHPSRWGKRSRSTVRDKTLAYTITCHLRNYVTCQLDVRKSRGFHVFRSLAKLKLWTEQ